MATELDAERLEVAQVQYYGWALKNQTAFLPSREQLDIATKLVEEYRIKLKAILVTQHEYSTITQLSRHTMKCARRKRSAVKKFSRKPNTLSPAHAAHPSRHAATAGLQYYIYILPKSY